MLRSSRLGTVATGPAGRGAVAHTTAVRAITAAIPPAMIHGFDVDDSPPPPPATRAPHSWQYAFPTGIGVWHDGHRGSLKAVPQLLQNFPVSRVPQLGHVVVVKKLSPAMVSGLCNVPWLNSLGRDRCEQDLQARLTLHLAVSYGIPAECHRRSRKRRAPGPPFGSNSDGSCLGSRHAFGNGLVPRPAFRQ